MNYGFAVFRLCLIIERFHMCTPTIAQSASSRVRSRQHVKKAQHNKSVEYPPNTYIVWFLQVVVKLQNVLHLIIHGETDGGGRDHFDVVD